MTKLSFEEFSRLRDYVYRHTGITFDDQKLDFVAKRLAKRIDDIGVGSAGEYLRYLKFSDPRGAELQAFINLLTTNETYFFREFDQLAAFAEHCLPELVEKKERLAMRRIKIWSAGCSTGEEPYTIAIILREMLEEPDEWQLDVLGTDIDTRVLRQAKQGVYDKRSVKDVPPEYLDAWFVQTRHGQFRVHPLLKKMCRFERLNFKDRTRMELVNNMDCVFCRNVLIYFDDEVRKEVVGSFHNSLNPGGFIFLGHSESMSRISTAFRLRRLGGMMVHQK